MHKNCQITFEDADRAIAIFGKDVPCLKGKTTRKCPKSVRIEIVNVPRYILDKNKEVTLSVDLFYTNKLPFFVSLSEAI